MVTQNTNSKNQNITAADVINMINRYPSMSAMPIEAFAEEGKLADQFVSALRRGKNINATQLRKFFHAIKNIQRQVQKGEEFHRGDIARMMPMLAYAVGRNELIPRDFYDLMKLCFGAEKCQTKEDFLRAADFLEAVMAYHKFQSN